MYSAKVLDHFHHPRNVGEISDATAVVEMTNPVCGDLMKLWVVVREGRVRQARFQTDGCVPAVACGSWLTGRIEGRELADLKTITPEEIEAALDGLPAASKHAAILASDALKRLLEELA